jgi:hypothetical protein
MGFTGERSIVALCRMFVRGAGLPSGFTPFLYRILAFALSSLVSWLYLASHSRGRRHRQPVRT